MQGISTQLKPVRIALIHQDVPLAQKKHATTGTKFNRPLLQQDIS
jgi:hypothetical protein